MNPSFSFDSNHHTQNSNNNQIDIVEDLLCYRSCPLHRGNPLISLFFSSKKDSEVFHCKLCEEECPLEHQQHSHDRLSHLNDDVDYETIILNLPVLSQHVLSRIQSALTFTFEGEIESIGNSNNQTTFSSLKQIKLRLIDTYNQFKQQKQIRDSLSKHFLDHEQQSVQLIQVVNFTKENQKQINEQLLSLLDDFEILKNTFELKQNKIQPNCIEQEQNKIDLESNKEGDPGQKGEENNCLKLHNQEIQLKISRLNELQTYENNKDKEKETEIIACEKSRMPKLNSLKLNLSQTHSIFSFFNDI